MTKEEIQANKATPAIIIFFIFFIFFSSLFLVTPTAPVFVCATDIIIFRTRNNVFIFKSYNLKVKFFVMFHKISPFIFYADIPQGNSLRDIVH